MTAVAMTAVTVVARARVEAMAAANAIAMAAETEGCNGDGLCDGCVGMNGIGNAQSPYLMQWPLSSLFLSSTHLDHFYILVVLPHLH